MIDLIKGNWEIWTSYWNGSWYFWMFLIACLYLLIRHRKKEFVRNILTLCLITLFVYWCPITTKIIQKCIGATVYKRVLWLTPTLIVIAIAAALLIYELSSAGKRVVCLVLILVIIGFGGKAVWEDEVYIKVTNRTQVPEAVAVIDRMIQEDAQGKPIYLAADDHVTTYIRVIDAQVRTPYGRRGYDRVNRLAKDLYTSLTLPARDDQFTAESAYKLGCNYLVVLLAADTNIGKYEKVGYESIGTVESYMIFANHRLEQENENGNGK